MRIEILEKPIETRNRKYPWIGINASKVIVLFTRLNIGTCLNGLSIGTHSSTWGEATFVEFEGKIILSNQ